MKKTFIISAIATLFFLSSCLDVDIVDQIERENQFYKTEDHALFAIQGVYSFLYDFNYHKTNWALVLTGYEDCMYVDGVAAESTISNNTHSSNTGPAVNFWGTLYAGIKDANEIIDRVPAIEFKSENDKNRILAEAHFLRALFHYDLVRLYGGPNGIPIRTTSTSGIADAAVPQSPKGDVYKQIISDFIYASGLNDDGSTRLPLQSESRFIRGRATNGAAHAFLAEVYLTIGEWQKAIDQSDIVLSSNEYKFLTDYKDLWSTEKELEAQSEHIFVLPFYNDKDAPLASSLGSNIAFWYNPNGVEVGGKAVSGNVYGKGSGNYKVQKWFIRYFQDDQGSLGYSDPTINASTDETNLIYKDYRIEVTFRRQFQQKNNQTGELGNIVHTYPATGSTTQNWGYIQKYCDPKGIDNRTNENDFPRMRLSDMYLIKAEALNELADYANACLAIDKVRERVREANGDERSFPKFISLSKSDNIGRILNKQEFRWLVFMERGLEFAGEQKRWFDLIRMRYNDNVSMYDYMRLDFIPSRPTGDVQTVGVMAARKKYLPIPFTETSHNSGVLQNPGY